MKKNSKLFLTLFLTCICFLILILSRYANIERSARFTRDESSDLLRIKQIYTAKRLTLVGPIGINNTSIHGSLSYYMVMPFAVVYGFDPIGPVVGTGFYSIIFVLLFAFLLSRFFGRPFWITILFLSFVFPFLQAGRWAWNPYYIPFWQILALAFGFFAYTIKDKARINKIAKLVLWIMAGFSLGLTVHNHWYAVFSVAGVEFIFLLQLVKNFKKTVKIFTLFSLGVFLAALLPFLIFDLKNPPGLFLTRFLYFSPLANQYHAPFTLITLMRDTISYLYINFKYFFQNELVTNIFLILLFIYIFYVYKYSLVPKKIILLIPTLFQVVGLVFLRAEPLKYYFLAGSIFILLFILIPDNKPRYPFVQKVILLYFFVFSLYPAFQEITKNDWTANIGRNRKIVDIIAKNFTNQRCNVFVPASPDRDGIGSKYRDWLKVKNIPVLENDEYNSYSCIFIITTSNLQAIEKDPSYELGLIKGRKPVNEWQVEDWKIYKFETKP